MRAYSRWLDVGSLVVLGCGADPALNRPMVQDEIAPQSEAERAIALLRSSIENDEGIAILAAGAIRFDVAPEVFGTKTEGSVRKAFEFAARTLPAGGVVEPESCGERLPGVATDLFGRVSRWGGGRDRLADPARAAAPRRRHPAGARWPRPRAAGRRRAADRRHPRPARPAAVARPRLRAAPRPVRSRPR